MLANMHNQPPSIATPNYIATTEEELDVSKLTQLQNYNIDLPKGDMHISTFYSPTNSKNMTKNGIQRNIDESLLDLSRLSGRLMHAEETQQDFSGKVYKLKKEIREEKDNDEAENDDSSDDYDGLFGSDNDSDDSN